MPADAPVTPVTPTDSLTARSIRFAITVTAPIALNLVLGPQPWLVYALVTAIACYSVDNGGAAGLRLAWMSAIGVGILAGAGLGSLVAPSHGLTITAFAFGGVVYALSESGHQATLTLARFFCFGIAIGALYMRIAPLDVAVVLGFVLFTWAISAGWDFAAGRWRPAELPALGAILQAMHARLLERWTFAVVLAIAVPVTFLVSSAAGQQKPYWAMLALILVLRVDFHSSRKLMVERFLGTVLGVAIAALYAALLPSHIALMIGLVLAALARWPAQQRHGALGVGAITAFVMLMIELVASSQGQALGLFEARVADTAIGCGVALLALLLERALYWAARRWLRATPAP
ncbi:FUSC family protein [Dongia sedimenti]|uniref:FUSC family protein n=1 Tax=Dongia sedimenti TaxID=3064282 RepID=A0ABU0YGL1_9PROT|nr:FUSC family protein [Rhodospirillaceae bacterium R-7]